MNKERPTCPWIRVDIELPPRGVKVQALTQGGILIVGEFGTDMCSLPKPFIICWQHLPHKPQNWLEILQEMGHA